MKKVLLIIALVSCVSICFAQGNGFNEFKKLFKKTELPFMIDSCSVQDLMWQNIKYPKISRRMKKFIPKDLYNQLFEEESVRAYFNLPISNKFVSLIIFAGSFIDDFYVSNSMLYLINYDFEGNIIDYIKIADYNEIKLSWCSIKYSVIQFNSFNPYTKSVSFKYNENEVIPMIERKLKYTIGMDGHFSKELLYYRKGIYKFAKDGYSFEFYKSFPE